MKKIIIVVLGLIVLNSLGGCMKRGEQLSNELGSEQQIADNVMEEVSQALDAKDADALKEMYSKKTRDEDTKLEQQILDLIDFYKGKKKSYEGHIFSSNTKEKGVNVEKLIKGMYELHTDSEDYRVYFKYKPVDEKNIDEVGLSSIELITETAYQKAVDADGSYDWQTGTKGSGVYIKELIENK